MKTGIKLLLAGIALLLAACGNHKDAWQDNTIRHHVLHPARYGKADIAFIEDTIRGLQVGCCLPTDGNVMDSVASPSPALAAAASAGLAPNCPSFLSTITTARPNCPFFTSHNNNPASFSVN